MLEPVRITNLGLRRHLGEEVILGRDESDAEPEMGRLLKNEKGLYFHPYRLGGKTLDSVLKRRPIETGQVVIISHRWYKIDMS